MAWYKVSNYGVNATADRERYAFALSFSTILSAAPQLELWADANLTDTNSEAVINGWIAAIDTTLAAPNTANWRPNSAVNGGSSTNILSGNTSYMTFSKIPSPNESVYFNLSMQIPSDAGTSAHTMYIGIRVFYSGQSPTITPRVNTSTQAVSYEDAPTNWQSYVVNNVGNFIQFSGPSDGTTPTDIPRPASGVLYNIPECYLSV